MQGKGFEPQNTCKMKPLVLLEPNECRGKEFEPKYQ